MREAQETIGEERGLGRPRQVIPDGANRYRYQGKERDLETGLDYYGYRYLCSWLGRWTCPDPGGTVDGLNLMSFVGGDPVGKRDVDGRQDEGTLTHESAPAMAASLRDESRILSAMNSALNDSALDDFYAGTLWETPREGWRLSPLGSAYDERIWRPPASVRISDVSEGVAYDLRGFNDAFEALLAGRPERMLDATGVPSTAEFIRTEFESRLSDEEYGRLLAAATLVDLVVAVESLSLVENFTQGGSSDLLSVFEGAKDRVIEYRNALEADPDRVEGALETLTAADHLLEVVENSIHPSGGVRTSRSMMVVYEGIKRVPLVGWAFRQVPRLSGDAEMTAPNSVVREAGRAGLQYAESGLGARAGSVLPTPSRFWELTP